MDSLPRQTTAPPDRLAGSSRRVHVLARDGIWDVPRLQAAYDAYTGDADR